MLSGKSEAEYITLFTVLRNRIGNFAVLRKVLIDFEPATHTAIRAIFPNVEIGGCQFHFGQALIRHMHAEKLRDKYLAADHDQDDEEQRDRMWHPVKKWFGSVKALTLLPLSLVPLGWQILQFDLHNALPPSLIDPHLDMPRLESFAQYFDTYWIGQRQFPHCVWNHFGNDGPRTTNHAEGYNSALNKNAIPEMHMALRNFLHAMQQEHNRIQQRVRKLYANLEAPKARKLTYVQLDQRIENEKIAFVNGTGHLWQFNNFDYRLLNRQDYEYLVDAIRHYLGRQKYRIGDKIATR